jgi:hypothetical protein
VAGIRHAQHVEELAEGENAEGHRLGFFANGIIAQNRAEIIE